MKVTLKADHTHNGVPHKANDEIEVEQHDAEWLAANKVIDPLPTGGKRGAAAEESKA